MNFSFGGNLYWLFFGFSRHSRILTSYGIYGVSVVGLRRQVGLGMPNETFVQKRILTALKKSNCITRPGQCLFGRVWA